MAKQISITFKETDREQDLLDWLNSKVSKGAFIKEQLLATMDNERAGIPQLQNVITEKKEDIKPKKQRGMKTLNELA